MNKNSHDVFFFEPTHSDFFVQPVFVEKQPPISKNENVPFDIDFYYVRGESAISKHMSLYGYGRKTTPYLDSIKNQLRLYYNAVSPEAGSAVSDTQVFSQSYSAPGNDFFTKAHMFEELKSQNIPIYNITYTLDQSAYENYVYDSIIESATANFATNSNDDMKLIDLLKAQVVDRPAFYFIQTAGSHVKYSTRSPDDVKIFGKQSTDSIKKKTINDYDDSIVYTDIVLKALHDFAKVRQKKTGRKYVIWYSSDHSQVLYRGGAKWANYSLDKSTVIGRDVPFFIINDKSLPCVGRLPKKNTPESPYLNTTQTFYWVLGSLCLYNGPELSINPSPLKK